MTNALRLSIAALLAAGVATPPVAAQGQINRGNVQYAINDIPDSHTSQSGNATFTAWAASLANLLPHHWWYFRVQGDTREFPFSNFDVNNDGSNTQGFVENYLTTVAFINWSDVDERGLMSASWKLRPYSTHPHRGVVSSQMTITNISGAPLTFNLFAYSDWDVCNNQNSVTGNANGSRQHIVNTGCNEFGEWVGVNPDHYQVMQWDVMRTRLLDTVIDDFNDSGLPFGPGDFVSGFQWQNRTLLPNQSATYTVLLAHGEMPCNVEWGQVNYGVPNPGTNGAPGIAAGRPSVIGSVNPPFRVNMTNGLANTALVVHIGFGRTNFQIPGTSLTVLTIPVVAVPLMYDGSGNVGFSFTVPNILSLCGLNVNFQALFADGGAPSNIAHTDGLEVTLGGY